MAASSDKLEPPIGGFLWQSAGKADNKPFDNRFFLSADGGATWTQYTFPIGTLAPKDALKEIAGIAREDNGRILLSINVDSGRNPTPIPEAIYESGADTATWRLVQAMPPGGNALTVLSPTEWVLFSTARIRGRVHRGRGRSLAHHDAVHLALLRLRLLRDAKYRLGNPGLLSIVGRRRPL